MMRSSKKGLGDSIWASRGKSSNFYNSSSSTSRPRPSQPTTSAIIPATPRPPSPKPASPTKNGSLGNDPVTSNGTATATPTTAAKDTKPGALSSQQEFKRYIQIVRRLKWKLPYLSHGYHHAIAKPGDPLYGGETDAEEAELMFKLDFYEYYMLLERALVHLLGVFGITVTSTLTREKRFVTPAQRNGADGHGASAGGEQGYRTTHAFHENIITALEREDNPLHEALGTGEVLICLFRAKELRNRWKYAEEGKGKEGHGRGKAAPLESYDLDGIFRHVFAGFDAGYAAAERKVAEDTGVAVGDGGIDEGTMMDLEEDEFDFMVEAMDWEAV